MKGWRGIASDYMSSTQHTAARLLLYYDTPMIWALSADMIGYLAVLALLLVIPVTAFAQRSRYTPSCHV